MLIQLLRRKHNWNRQKRVMRTFLKSKTDLTKIEVNQRQLKINNEVNMQKMQI